MKFYEKYEQINELLDTIKEAINYIGNQMNEAIFEREDFLFMDIRSAINSVNQELFSSPILKEYDTNTVLLEASRHRDTQLILSKCRDWLELATATIEKRVSCKNYIDERFVRIMDYARYVDSSIIVNNTKKILHSMPEEHVLRFNLYYQKYYYFWGMLDTENGNYEVIENRVQALVNHREDFEWLYYKLGDYRSKLVLCNILQHWITFDLNQILNMRENNFKDYYDLDLLKCDENEIVVDLGTFTGDSVLDYIEVYGAYKKIYCYEISQENADIAEKNLAEFDNIQLCRKGVGEKNGVMYIDERSSSSECFVNENSGSQVDIVTIDDDISEKITLIKMDIEGSEQSALIGCRKHIVEEKPKLLICVYHNNEDIWKIPRMIMEMRPDYKLYLRSNGEQWGPAEIVLFAL